MSTQLRKIAAKAKQDPKARFTSLAHLLTPEFLRETWRQRNRKGASGIDGETIQEFETRKCSIRDFDLARLRACPGKPGAGNPHAGFYLGGEVQGQPRLLPTDHQIDHDALLAKTQAATRHSSATQSLAHSGPSGRGPTLSHHGRYAPRRHGCAAKRIVVMLNIAERKSSVESVLPPKHAG
jgi:hypothetical protein